MSNDAVANLLHENRYFPPTEQFSAVANAQPDLYEQAKTDRIKFWRLKLAG